MNGGQLAAIHGFYPKNTPLMSLNIPWCIKSVGDCPYCNSKCIKNGKTNSGKQRYRCKECNKTHLIDYKNLACVIGVSSAIISLLKEGCGVRSIARLLKISTSTVLKRLLSIARKLKKPLIVSGQTYELDELCTYVQQKTRQCWVVYALRRDTKEVVDFTVGNRSNAVLKRVTDTLVLSGAKKIYTDKLKQYITLLPKSLHRTSLHGTNYIERMNLTLRTHLKRLSRRTICYSKSVVMLVACLKIYFWS